MTSSQTPRLGVRENIGQFSLLVVINAFVGAMVGLERTVLPLIAEKEFALASKTAILSFIISFGIVKAFCNYLAGTLSDKIGRKRLLVLGWIAGLPVPFLVMYAPTWNWIIAANLLLGANQGFCWSTTVIMKIDLAGPQRRGLAMGLNEFAGYVSVALAALASGTLQAHIHFVRNPSIWELPLPASDCCFPWPWYAKRMDTLCMKQKEMQNAQQAKQMSNMEVFARTSWKDKTLFSCSQAGLVNNLNDGMAWGLLPIFFASGGLPVEKIGQLAAIYPATWGLLQLYTGALSDRIGRKSIIVSGMLIQALGILLIPISKELLVLGGKFNSARRWDSPGIPDIIGRHRRCCGSQMASFGCWSLPALARFGVRCRCNSVRNCSGSSGHWIFHHFRRDAYTFFWDCRREIDARNLAACPSAQSKRRT